MKIKLHLKSRLTSTKKKQKIVRHRFQYVFNLSLKSIALISKIRNMYLFCCFRLTHPGYFELFFLKEIQISNIDKFV